MGGDNSKNAKLWQNVFEETTKEASAVSSTVLKSALTEAKKGMCVAFAARARKMR